MEKALVVSCNLSEIFETFEEDPVDSGSIAQYMLGYLKNSRRF
jgi:predicted unusual protein kinase regulating ubiquinone biosynthesis (AarF/ABC1/UbiB family)